MFSPYLLLFQTRTRIKEKLNFVNTTTAGSTAGVGRGNASKILDKLNETWRTPDLLPPPLTSMMGKTAYFRFSTFFIDSGGGGGEGGFIAGER